MNIDLIKRVGEEEQVAIKKWGHVDRSPVDLLGALLEEAGEVAHAVNHNEGPAQVNQEIVEAIGILSRLYNMVNGCPLLLLVKEAEVNIDKAIELLKDIDLWRATMSSDDIEAIKLGIEALKRFKIWRAIDTYPGFKTLLPRETDS